MPTKEKKAKTEKKSVKKVVKPKKLSQTDYEKKVLELAGKDLTSE